MKEDPCEIYVRNSGGSNLLHRYGNSASLATHSAGGEPVAFLELSVERFNCTVRYEWLSQYCWSSIEEVQDFATQWMWSYNNDRPNMALGGFTPKQRLAMAA